MTDLMQRLRESATGDERADAMLDLAADELARLRAECEALRADAERYRWIRNDWAVLVSLAPDSRYPLPNPIGGTEFWRARDHIFTVESHEEFDAAIDAARKGEA